jgi:sugar phosphate isomerase/epimerase
MVTDPRIAVSAVSTWHHTPTEDLAFWARHAIDHVGLSVQKLAAAGWEEAPATIERIRDAGLQVSSVGTVGYFALDQPDTWGPANETVRRAVDVATSVGAERVVVVTGSAGALEWDDAAEAFARAIAPAVEVATSGGIRLALENTASLRVDYGFVHTLRDTVDVAAANGLSVCLEIQSCWAERGLGRTIAGNVDAIALVQLSDFVRGSTTTPDRVALGDGDIPLERIVGQLLDAGYRGPFEIELIGPRVTPDRYDSAVTTSMAVLHDLLVRLAA